MADKKSKTDTTSDVPAVLVDHDRGTPIAAGHRIRAYPTVGQHSKMVLQCVAAHIAYNWAVSFQRIAEDFWIECGDPDDPCFREYRSLSYDELREINKAWKDEWRPLMRQKLPHYGFEADDADLVVSHVCYQALRNWDKAYRQHIKWLAGGCKGRKVGAPRFKRWGGRTSATILPSASKAEGRFVGKKVMLPGSQKDKSGIGWVKLAEEVRFQGKITSARMELSAGQWHVIPQITEIRLPDEAREIRSAVGIDLGVRDAATIADAATDKVVALPGALDFEWEYRLLMKRTKSAQRKLSRCIEQAKLEGRSDSRGRMRGPKSRRHKRLDEVIARLKARQARIMDDRIHKQTTAIVRGADLIGLEDLSVQPMMSAGGKRKKGLNRGIATVKMGDWRHKIEYKAGWYGAQVAVADKWHPSTKLCRKCGHRNGDMGVRDKIFVCEMCGHTDGRDRNAAKNLADLAAAAAYVDRGGLVPSECLVSLRASPAGFGGAGAVDDDVRAIYTDRYFRRRFRGWWLTQPTTRELQ